MDGEGEGEGEGEGATWTEQEQEEVRACVRVLTAAASPSLVCDAVASCPPGARAESVGSESKEELHVGHMGVTGS